MSDAPNDADLYETDAAYVEAWERWVIEQKPKRRKLTWKDVETLRKDEERQVMKAMIATLPSEIDQ